MAANNNKGNPNGKPGRGMGKGVGIGERPEEDSKTSLRDTQVKQNSRQNDTIARRIGAAQNQTAVPLPGGGGTAAATNGED